MGTISKFRLRRKNGTAYDIFHPETQTGVVMPTPGSLVMFDGKQWQVQHIEGNYAYLMLTPMLEKTAFGSSVVYSGSTIATKCATFQASMSAAALERCEEVTIQGVTTKVWIPTYTQLTGVGNDTGPAFSYASANAANRICKYDGSASGYWLSTVSSDGTKISYIKASGTVGTTTNITTEVGFRPCIKVSLALDVVIAELSNHVINGGTTTPTNQPIGGLWFQDIT